MERGQNSSVLVVYCSFKMTTLSNLLLPSKLRPLMASDKCTVNLLRSQRFTIDFESERSCNYNVQPQLCGVECTYYCITKMEAIMQLLSSNISHPDLTLWNFSKSQNLQILNMTPIDNLAIAKQAKTKLRNITAKLLFSISACFC